MVYQTYGTALSAMCDSLFAQDLRLQQQLFAEREFNLASERRKVPNQGFAAQGHWHTRREGARRRKRHDNGKSLALLNWFCCNVLIHCIKDTFRGHQYATLDARDLVFPGYANDENAFHFMPQLFWLREMLVDVDCPTNEASAAQKDPKKHKPRRSIKPSRLPRGLAEKFQSKLVAFFEHAGTCKILAHTAASLEYCIFCSRSDAWRTCKFSGSPLSSPSSVSSFEQVDAAFFEVRRKGAFVIYQQPRRLINARTAAIVKHVNDRGIRLRGRSRRLHAGQWSAGTH